MTHFDPDEILDLPAMKMVMCANPECAVQVFDVLRTDVCPSCCDKPTYRVSYLEWMIAPLEN